MMVVLVFYGGAGINFISYCCNECQSKGIEVIQNNECCYIHHHHENTCDEYSSDECSLERINFDWSSYELSKQDLSPDYFTLFTCNLLNDSYLGFNVSGDIITPAPHRPPLVLPRDYLSVLTVLLI